MKEKTISQYTNVIIRVHPIFVKIKKIDDNLRDAITKIFNDDINDSDIIYIKKHLKYLKNPPKFLDKIKEIYNNVSTQKGYIVPYVVLSRMLKNYDKMFFKAHEYLSKQAMVLNEKYEAVRDDNAVSDEDVRKIITDYDIDTLLENIKKLDKPLHKLLYALYVFTPPRRNEYQNIYIVNYKAKLDKDKNYILLNKKYPTHFVFNNYKTADKYGSQKIEIPTQLAKIIYNYIKENKLKSGDKLITISINNYIQNIKKAFKIVYGIDGITTRWLRISYATYIDNVKMSNNDKNKIVENMGHSAQQSSKYRKLI
jgi:hypothetical protein